MTPRPRSCLSTALVDRDELVGVLSLYSSNRDAFTPDHERVVEIVARQVATGLRHAAEFQSTKASSLRDRTTGLPNIEQFIQFSRAAEESTAMTSAPASLLLVHVTNLRQIATDLGRPAAENAFNLVVDATRRVLRATDMLFRHEDDQLIAVMLQTNDTTADALAGRLLDALRVTRASETHSVLVATALSTSPNDGRNFEALLKVARKRVQKSDGSGEPPAIDRVH